MFITQDDAQIFATAFGSRQAPTLLALSGWIGSWEDWADTLSLLSNEWHTLAYDHRGSGAAIAPLASITFEHLVDDVFAVLDAYGVERCVLAAMSMGAGVALAAVLKQPARFSGLVIVNGAYFRETPVSQDAFYQALQVHYEQALDRFADACIPEPDSAALKRWGRQILARATKDAALRLYQMGDEIDLRGRVGEISVPTLIVHGDADRLIPIESAQWLTQAISGAKLVTIEGAGHVPIMTRPYEVARAINQFFGVTSHS